MSDSHLPLVSIVTPYFNQASYLDETIRTVLGKVYPRTEYMIVYGGSADGSVSIIKKYATQISRWVLEDIHYPKPEFHAQSGVNNPERQQFCESL